MFVIKNKLILRLLHFAGIDRAIGYGVLTRIWGLIAGPISIFIIALRFSREQQGFFYTFSSLLAMQMFFELGLTGVVSTFTSHEFVNLRWGAHGEINGDSVSIRRFTDLLSKTSKWFGVASLILIAGLIPAGFFFFDYGQRVVLDFSWRLPWILAVIGTALNLSIMPFFAVIMGSGDVATVNYRELIGIVVGSCISWLIIWFNGGLYAVFAVSFGNIIISYAYLIKQKPKLLELTWEAIYNPKRGLSRHETISWWSEIWPIQWKIAISWISGYFLLQLFTPILFHYHGATIAGQMGMTLSASTALLGINLTLMNAKYPEFGRLIAIQDWTNLDLIFHKVQTQSLLALISGSVLGCGLLWFLQTYYPSLGNRFVPSTQAGLLFITISLVGFINGFATYLRAHKKEPFTILLVVTALIQSGAVWYFGKYYSSLGTILAYLLVTLFVSLPAAYYIWQKCRTTWHDIK